MKSILGKVFLLAFVFHVILSLYLTFFPKNGQLGKSWPAKFYEYFVHLGPFFMESKVKSYSDFSVVILEKNKWRDIHVTKKEIDLYQKNIFAVRHLTIRDFLNHNARLFNESRRRTNSESFRKLHAFVKKEYLNENSADSIRWVFRTMWFNPEDNTIKGEVIFDFQYSPVNVE